MSRLKFLGVLKKTILPPKPEPISHENTISSTITPRSHTNSDSPINASSHNVPENNEFAERTREALLQKKRDYMRERRAEEREIMESENETLQAAAIRSPKATRRKRREGGKLVDVEPEELERLVAGSPSPKPTTRKTRKMPPVAGTDGDFVDDFIDMDDTNEPEPVSDDDFAPSGTKKKRTNTKSRSTKKRINKKESASGSRKRKRDNSESAKRGSRKKKRGADKKSAVDETPAVTEEDYKYSGIANTVSNNAVEYYMTRRMKKKFSVVMNYLADKIEPTLANMPSDTVTLWDDVTGEAWGVWSGDSMPFLIRMYATRKWLQDLCTRLRLHARAIVDWDHKEFYKDESEGPHLVCHGDIFCYNLAMRFLARPDLWNGVELLENACNNAEDAIPEGPHNLDNDYYRFNLKYLVNWFTVHSAQEFGITAHPRDDASRAVLVAEKTKYEKKIEMHNEQMYHERHWRLCEWWRHWYAPGNPNVNEAAIEGRAKQK